MIERIRDNPDDLEALVGITAEALGMPAAYVEKDFWVTEVLRAASVDRAVGLPDGSTATTTFTFKGGTSLSRVFGIVERFSEDVDLLAVFPAEASLNARHRVLKEVDEAVKDHLALVGYQRSVSSSTKGIKRYTTYGYPGGRHDLSLKEGVLLELGSRGGTQPFTVRSFRSLLADHAIAALGENEESWEEFAAFTVNVLAPERTLFEKLAAVHDAASRANSDALLKYGRHFYDIHCLLQDDQVISELVLLGDEGVRALVADIDSQSTAADFSSTPRPPEGYGHSPAFDRTHSMRNTIETGYEAAQALVYGELIPFDLTIDTVRHRSGLL